MPEASKPTSVRRHLVLIPLWLYLAAMAVLVLTAPAKASARPTGLVICEVFGDRHCAQALRVAWCESRFDTRARNGQYRGLFQMGSWERRKYGHGSTAREQARAAYRYFVATGRTWGPWECKP